MKKQLQTTLLLIAAVAVALLISACGGSSSTTTPVAPTPTTPSTTPGASKNPAVQKLRVYAQCLSQHKVHYKSLSAALANKTGACHSLVPSVQVAKKASQPFNKGIQKLKAEGQCMIAHGIKPGMVIEIPGSSQQAITAYHAAAKACGVPLK